MKTASTDDRFDVPAAACPTHQMIFRLGERWTLLVLYALEARPHRLRDLQRSVEGISQQMLTQTLRNLEGDGLVDRTMAATPPSQTTYSLTSLGRLLIEPISVIRTWAYGTIDELQASRGRHDAEAAEGVVAAAGERQ